MFLFLFIFLVGPLYSTKRPDQVVSVACGSSHTIVLTNLGAVYTMGSNDYGMLGVGYTNEDVTMPRKVEGLGPNRIGQIAAGDTFSLVVSLSGRRLYKFGKLASKTEYLMPTLIKQFPSNNMEINRVEAFGRNCIFLVTNDEGEQSEVYTLGSDLRALGRGKLKTINAKPGLVKRLNNKRISSISCGARHMAAITDQGSLYTWGYGNQGELGNQKIQSHPILFPRCYKPLPGYTAFEIVCGNGFSIGVFTTDDDAKRKLLPKVEEERRPLSPKYQYESVYVPVKYENLEVSNSVANYQEQI